MILSSGAVNSPQLLELSGIGNGARLQNLGIEVVQDLRGVGENLQDHLQLRMAYKVDGVRTLNTASAHWWGKLMIGLQYALFQSGPMSMAPSQLGAFAKSDPDDRSLTRPDLEYHVQPLSLDRFGEPLHRFNAFTASVCQLRPTSRGSIHIVSPEPHTPPLIAPNYLSTDYDRHVAANALRLTRRIAAAPALAPIGRRRFCPASSSRPKKNCSRPPARSARPSFIRSALAAWAPPDDPGRRRRSAPARDRCRRFARGRCVGHAYHHLGQYQLADADDRRARERHDSRGSSRTSCRARHRRHARRASMSIA